MATIYENLNDAQVALTREIAAQVTAGPDIWWDRDTEAEKDMLRAQLQTHNGRPGNVSEDRGFALQMARLVPQDAHGRFLDAVKAEAQEIVDREAKGSVFDAELIDLYAQFFAGPGQFFLGRTVTLEQGGVLPDAQPMQAPRREAPAEEGRRHRMLTIGSGTKEGPHEIYDLIHPLTGSPTENPIIYVNVESNPERHRNFLTNWAGMSAFFDGAGIAPVYFGDILGGHVKDPNDDKKELPYQQAYSLPAAEEALKELSEAVRDGHVGPELRRRLEESASGRTVIAAMEAGKPVSIVLQCSEDNIVNCHRLYLSELLERNHGVTPEHLVRLRGGKNPVDTLVSHDVARSAALTQMKLYGDAYLTPGKPWTDDARAWVLWEHATHMGAKPLGHRAATGWFDRQLNQHLLLHPDQGGAMLDALHESISAGDMWFQGVLMDDNDKPLHADAVLLTGNLRASNEEKGLPANAPGAPSVTVVGGGAYGADRLGDAVAKALGWGSVQYYAGFVPTPFGNTQMPDGKEYMEDAQKALSAAIKTLGRYPDIDGDVSKIPPYIYNLLIRDYAQVRESDSVYAFGHWQDAAEGLVAGGTGYAVQMAKGVRDTFFYDIDTSQWYARLRGGNGSWEHLDGAPRLSARPAVIGTRELTTEAAKEFIGSVQATLAQGVRMVPDLKTLQQIDSARKKSRAITESSATKANADETARQRRAALVTMRTATRQVSKESIERVGGDIVTLLAPGALSRDIQKENVFTLPLMDERDPDGDRLWTDDDIEVFREHMDAAVDAISKYISDNASTLKYIILPYGNINEYIKPETNPQISAYYEAKMSLLRARSAKSLSDAGRMLQVESPGARREESPRRRRRASESIADEGFRMEKPVSPTLILQSFNGDVLDPSVLLDESGRPVNVDPQFPHDPEAVNPAFRRNANLNSLYIFAAPAANGPEEASFTGRDISDDECRLVLRSRLLQEIESSADAVALRDHIESIKDEISATHPFDAESLGRLEAELKAATDQYDAITTLPDVSEMTFSTDDIAIVRSELMAQRQSLVANYASLRNNMNPSVLTFPSVRQLDMRIVTDNQAIGSLRDAYVRNATAAIRDERESTETLFSKILSGALECIADARPVPTRDDDPSRYLTSAEIGAAQESFLQAYAEGNEEAAASQQASLEALVRERIGLKRDTALSLLQDRETEAAKGASARFDSEVLPGLSSAEIESARLALVRDSRREGAWTDDDVEEFREAAKTFFMDLLASTETARQVLFDKNICMEDSVTGIDPTRAPKCAEVFREELEGFMVSLRERGRNVYDFRYRVPARSAKESRESGITDIYTRGERTGVKIRRNKFNIYGGQNVDNAVAFDPGDPNHAYLSAPAPHPFVDGTGLKWSCAEQYFHAQKALSIGNTKAYETLRQTPSGSACRRIGHSIRMTAAQQEAWNDRRTGVMFEALVRIAEQDPAFREALDSIPENAAVTHLDPTGKADTGEWAELYPRTLLAARTFVSEGKKLVSGRSSTALSHTVRLHVGTVPGRDAFDAFRVSYGGAARGFDAADPDRLGSEIRLAQEVLEKAKDIPAPQREELLSDLPHAAAVLKGVLNSDTVYLVDSRPLGSNGLPYGEHSADYIFTIAAARELNIPVYELGRDGAWRRPDMVSEAKNVTVSHFVGNWNRSDVEKDARRLYVFTDNTDRDSGRGVIDRKSEYYKRYGDGTNELHFPQTTAAVIRGLANAMPVSTQRWYHDGAKGENGRWNDADAEEFRKVISSEFAAIREAMASGRYDEVVFPSADGLFGGAISQITEERTPALHAILKNEYDALVAYASSLKIKEARKLEPNPVTGYWFALDERGPLSQEQEQRLSALFRSSEKASRNGDLRVFTRKDTAFKESAGDPHAIRVNTKNKVSAVGFAQRQMKIDSFIEKSISERKTAYSKNPITASLVGDIPFPLNSPSGKPWSDDAFVADPDLFTKARTLLNELKAAMRTMEESGRSNLKEAPRGGLFEYLPSNPAEMMAMAFLKADPLMDGEEAYGKLVSGATSVISALGGVLPETPEEVLKGAAKALRGLDTGSLSSLLSGKDMHDRIITLDNLRAEGGDLSGATDEEIEAASYIVSHFRSAADDGELLKGNAMLVHGARLIIENLRRDNALALPLYETLPSMRTLVPKGMFLGGTTWKDFYLCAARLERNPAMSMPEGLSASSIKNVSDNLNALLENPYVSIRLAMEQIRDAGLFSGANIRTGIISKDAATGEYSVGREFSISRIVVPAGLEQALPPKCAALYRGLKELLLTGEESALAKANAEQHEADLTLSRRTSDGHGEAFANIRTRARADEVWFTEAQDAEVSQEEAVRRLASLSHGELLNLLSRVEMPSGMRETTHEDYLRIARNLGVDPQQKGWRTDGDIARGTAPLIRDSADNSWADGLSDGAIVRTASMLIRPDGEFSALGRGEMLVASLPAMADYMNANASAPEMSQLSGLFGGVAKRDLPHVTDDMLIAMRDASPADFRTVSDAVRKSCLVDLLWRLPAPMQRFLAAMRSYVSVKDTRRFSDYDLLITNSSSAVKAIGSTKVSAVADTRKGGQLNLDEMAAARKAGADYGIYQGLIRATTFRGYRDTMHSRKPLTVSAMAGAYQDEIRKRSGTRSSSHMKKDGSKSTLFGMGSILTNVERNRAAGDGSVVMAITSGSTFMGPSQNGSSQSFTSGALISAVALARETGLRIGFMRGRDAEEVVSLREAIDEALGDKEVLAGDPLSIEFSEDGSYSIPPLMDKDGKPVLDSRGEPVPSVILGPKAGRALREDEPELEGNWNYGVAVDVSTGGASRERVFAELVPQTDVVVNIRTGKDAYSTFVEKASAGGPVVVNMIIPDGLDAARTLRSAEYAARQEKALREAVAKARMASGLMDRRMRITVTAGTMTQLSNEGPTDVYQTYSQKDLRVLRGDRGPDDKGFDLHPDSATGVTSEDLNIFWRNILEGISSGSSGLTVEVEDEDGSMERAAYESAGDLDITYVGDQSTLPLITAEQRQIALSGAARQPKAVFPAGWRTSFDTGGLTAVTVASKRLALGALATGASLKREAVEHDQRHEGANLPDVVLVTLSEAGLTGEEIMRVRDYAQRFGYWVERRERFDKEGVLCEDYAESLSSLLSGCDFLRDSFSSVKEAEQFMSALSDVDRLAALEEKARTRIEGWLADGIQLVTANSEHYPQEFLSINPAYRSETVRTVRLRRPRISRGGEPADKRPVVMGSDDIRESTRRRAVGRPAFFTVKGDLNALLMPKVTVASPSQARPADDAAVNQVADYLRRHSLSPVVSVPRADFMPEHAGALKSSLIERPVDRVRTDITIHEGAAYRVLLSAHPDEETLAREYSDFNLLPRPVAVTGARFDDPHEKDWIDELSGGAGLVLSACPAGVRTDLTDLQSDLMAGALGGAVLQIGGGVNNVALSGNAVTDGPYIIGGPVFDRESVMAYSKANVIDRDEDGDVRSITEGLDASGIAEKVQAGNPVIVKMQKDRNAREEARRAKEAVERERVAHLQQDPARYTIRALRSAGRTVYEVPSETLQSVRDALVRDFGVKQEDIVEPGQAAALMPPTVPSALSSVRGTMACGSVSSEVRFIYRGGHVYTPATAPEGTPGLPPLADRRRAALDWERFTQEVLSAQRSFQEELGLPKDVPFRFSKAYYVWGAPEVNPTDIYVVGDGAVRLHVWLDEKGQIAYDKGYGAYYDEHSRLDRGVYDIDPYLEARRGVIDSDSVLDSLRQQIESRLKYKSEFSMVNADKLAILEPGADQNTHVSSFSFNREEADEMLRSEQAGYRTHETQDNIDVAYNDVDLAPALAEDASVLSAEEVYMDVAVRLEALRNRLSGIDAEVDDTDRKIAASRDAMKFVTRKASGESSADESEDSEKTLDGALEQAGASTSSELSDAYAGQSAADDAETPKERSRSELEALQRRSGDLRVERTRIASEAAGLERMLDTIALVDATQKASMDARTDVPAFTVSGGTPAVYGRECRGVDHLGAAQAKDLAEYAGHMRARAAELTSRALAERNRRLQYETPADQAARQVSRKALAQEIVPGSQSGGLCIVSRFGCQAYAKADTLDIIGAFYHKVFRFDPAVGKDGTGMALSEDGRLFLLKADGTERLKNRHGAADDTSWGVVTEGQGATAKTDPAVTSNGSVMKKFSLPGGGQSAIAVIDEKAGTARLLSLSVDGKDVSWFDGIESFVKGLDKKGNVMYEYARVYKKGAGYNFIDTEGNLLSKEWFKKAGKIKDGTATAATKDGKSLILDLHRKSKTKSK